MVQNKVHRQRMCLGWQAIVVAAVVVLVVDDVGGSDVRVVVHVVANLIENVLNHLLEEH